MCIDRAVLRMCADESDINHAIGIIDPDHDAILIAGDIEDDAAISQDAGRSNITLHIVGLAQSAAFTWRTQAII
jgi:hypothetical protein